MAKVISKRTVFFYGKAIHGTRVADVYISEEKKEGLFGRVSSVCRISYLYGDCGLTDEIVKVAVEEAMEIAKSTIAMRFSAKTFSEPIYYYGGD